MIEGWAAAAVAGAAVIGGAASVIGAGEQASASENATNAQESMFNQQVANEKPFMTAGTQDVNELNYLMGTGPKTGTGINPALGGYGSLNAPFNVSDWKSLSPAYNFNLQQGAQGTLNSASSSQGGESGAALSGLQAYNQGAANNSFNNAFNMYQTQQSNTYGRLAGIANLGEAAASNQATGGSSYAQGIGQSLTNTGTAIGGGIAGAGNAVGNAALLGALYQGQPGGSIPAGATTTGNSEMDYYCDYGLKKNIEPYRFHGTAGLMEYTFNWKGEDDDAPKSYGPIAQEVEKLYPEAVSRGPKGYLKINYSKLPGWDEIEAPLDA
jgi:Chaperone of endosialidase